MVSSSPSGAATDDRAQRAVADYFAARRARVDGFVARHFKWPGTLRLHGAALGWDILRAPCNVFLSPVLVLARLASAVCRLTRQHAAADWLARRRIMVRTAVAGRVEALIVSDLLELPSADGALAPDPQALAHAVLAAPQFREVIRTRESAAEVEALGHRIAGALGEYAGTRSAVAEIATTLCVLIVGALAFQALTPGMISMAPGVADALARGRAIADFPLGQMLGGMWYGVFPVGASPWLVGTSVVGLLMAGSVFAAFAGVFADPVQSHLGIHRRRLLRLLDTLERDLADHGSWPFVAREHFYARALDLWDVAASMVRAFRG